MCTSIKKEKGKYSDFPSSVGLKTIQNKKNYSNFLNLFFTLTISFKK